MADNTFDTWALVELMGHSRIAGRVTDATIGGATFAVECAGRTSGGQPSHTRYFSPAAIYGISPVTPGNRKDWRRNSTTGFQHL